MARLFRRIAVDAPHPLREMFLLWFVAFWAAFFLGVFHVRGPLRPTLGILGAAGVLLGATLATNLAGAADFWAGLAADHRPLGIDYSKSIFRRPAFVRLFGLFFAAVGVSFIIGSLQGTA
jgi:hypothetical protein